MTFEFQELLSKLLTPIRLQLKVTTALQPIAWEIAWSGIVNNCAETSTKVFVWNLYAASLFYYVSLFIYI